MKEQFVKAEMDIVEFEVEDIITTSGNGNSDDWNPDSNELPRF